MRATRDSTSRGKGQFEQDPFRTISLDYCSLHSRPLLYIAIILGSGCDQQNYLMLLCIAKAQFFTAFLHARFFSLKASTKPLVELVDAHGPTPPAGLVWVPRALVAAGRRLPVLQQVRVLVTAPALRQEEAQYSTARENTTLDVNSSNRSSCNTKLSRRSFFFFPCRPPHPDPIEYVTRSIRWGRDVTPGVKMGTSCRRVLDFASH